VKGKRDERWRLVYAVAKKVEKTLVARRKRRGVRQKKKKLWKLGEGGGTDPHRVKIPGGERGCPPSRREKGAWTPSTEKKKGSD